MIYGNWVAIHKAFVKYLPNDRPYTELEAMFCLSVDSDNENHVSISGYSALWKWSRSKVRKFLSDMELSIYYPESTDKKQNQKGQIEGQIRDRSGTDQRQIRFIIDKALYGVKDRSGTDQRQIRDRSKDTTIDPIDPDPNPDPKDNINGINLEFCPDNNDIEKCIDFIINLSNRLFTRDGYEIDLKDFNARNMIGLRIAEQGFDVVKSAVEHSVSAYYGSKKMYKMCHWEKLFRDTTIRDLYTQSKLSPPMEESSGNTIADRMTKQSDLTSQATREII